MALDRVRRLGARTPLRVRLVVAVLLLAALALVGSGAVATATLRSYLTHRLDDQLRSVAQRPVADLLRSMTGGPGGADPDHDHVHDGTPSTFVTEVVNAHGTALYGGPDSNLIDPDEPLPALPRITPTSISGTSFTTVDARSGSQEWRVLIERVTLPGGKPGAVIIAQGLGDVNDTVSRLEFLLIVVGAAAVIVIGAVGYAVVRISLRPLRAVERTAVDIAAGDLTHRVPDADPHTEVGQVAEALNTMLTNIEQAFAARTASELEAQRSAERAQESEATARESERRMRRFIADASHELRTPLTTIRGFAELYRQGAVPAGDVAGVLRRIEDEARRMGLLVEDLLTLARLDAERPLAQEPVDVLAVARDAVEGARATAPGRSIGLAVGNTEPAPIVTGDDTRLRQVLGNLLANAIKYSPEDAPVEVTVATRTDPSPTVSVTVADHGPGLSPEAAERVFDRFYRADAARNRHDGGSGLGLSIVAAIVAAHAGSVHVDTEPGAGARFTVDLPLARPDVPAAAEDN